MADSINPVHWFEISVNDMDRARSSMKVCSGSSSASIGWSPP